MIESISVKNIATYNNNGICIDGLQKVNFIYGANASGKTTISNFVMDVLDNKYQDCRLKWKHDIGLEILVYNKKFRDENFGNGDIKGVFTLGAATKETVELIKEKKVELDGIKNNGIRYKDALDKQKSKKLKFEDEYKEDIWKKIYKKYESSFKEAFKGSMNKETFRTKLLLEFNINTSDLLILDNLLQHSKTIFGETPKNIFTITNISFDRLVTIESDEIWKKKIIGKSDVDIATLIQKLNINDWVNQGKEYLQNDGVCPFCQQSTITDEFKKQLEDYFDDNFTKAIEKVKTISSAYLAQSQNILNELKQIEGNEKNNKDTKLDLDKFTAYLKTYESQIISNKELINSKIKEPSRSIELTSTKEQLENIQQLIVDANEEIKKHNTIVSNYREEKTKLIGAIWKYIIEEFRDDIVSYLKKIKGLEKGITELDKRYQEKRIEYGTLNNEIKELNKDVTSIQPTIDEINKILQYYGFLNFEIVPSDSNKNHYQIKREDGSLAEETLSEGEITFMTFLYFFQLAKGSVNKEEISKDRILVVDDPISSLDSNVLFIVSTLLKSIMEDVKNEVGNIKQIIILTHNVYFHKEVSFIDGRSNGDRNTHFWILRKKDKVTTIQPYEIKNPIQTSYQLLWQELKDKEENSRITIQNTMRRIIENYFKILGGYKDDHLVEKFESHEERLICKSLISWINDGSHSVPDDLFVELQEEAIEKYLEVFKNIFKHTGHEGHYNMMIGIDND